MGELIIKMGLKERLDQIDSETIYHGLPSFIDATIETKRGMWRKGCAVIEVYPEAKDYNGKPGGNRQSIVNNLQCFSWAMLEKETGRPHNTIKSWVQIAKRIGDNEDAFNVWAENERIEIEGRFKKKILSLKESVETPLLPDEKYSVIYADPAWPVGSIVMDKWESPIDDKYPTMSIEDIKNLPIKDLTAEDCSLFIWTTHSFLPDCLDIIKEWGFKYFCTITWNKGSGWTQNGFHKMTEFLLFGYKGKMNIDQYGKAIPTLISENKGIHSKKPDSIRDLIKDKTPVGRLELFARDEYDGWTVWGNEIKITENE